MNVIATKDIALLRYLLGSPVTAPELYRQIRASFPNGEVYKFFAEPIVLEGGLKLAWSSSYAGKAVSYGRLSEQDKSMAQDMLNKAISDLMEAVKTFNDSNLQSFISNCIEIPSLDSVYIVDTNGEKHVVATQWGFVPDTPGAEKGLLIKFLNIKKVPMRFQVVYSDNMDPAPGEDIIFEVDGKPMQGKSDIDGVIVLEKIKEGAFVKAFEASDAEKINSQNYTCYEDEQYTIKVTPKGDMKFQVVDQFGNPQHSQNFQFEYDGQKISAVSNADGIITLERIKSGTRVEAYQPQADGSRKYENVYLFDRLVNPYRIAIEVEVAPEPELPKTHNMRFKVVDDKNNVVKSAEITVKYLGKTETLMTDAEGYAVLMDVPVGTVVEARAKK